MASKVKATRSRKPKVELQEEFDLIQEEVAESYSNTKSEEARKQKETEIQESIKDLGVDPILRKFADLNSEISKTFSHLSEKMISEVNLLSNLRQAVSIQRKEIENLHKIDIAQTAMDQLVEEYNQQKETLELELETTRQNWEQETQLREKEIKEFEEALKKSRQREIDDYEYKKNLERKKAQDKYDEEVRIQEKRNRENQESLEKTWKERENSLKVQEEEVSLLRKTVEGFSSTLKKECEKAVLDAIKQTEQKFSQEILFLKRDADADQKIADLKIKSLEEVILRQLAQIGALQTQAEEAKQQVQDIAIRAIEGASGARALSHINQIAMEQAKTRATSSS